MDESPTLSKSNVGEVGRLEQGCGKNSDFYGLRGDSSGNELEMGLLYYKVKRVVGRSYNMCFVQSKVKIGGNQTYILDPKNMCMYSVDQRFGQPIVFH